MSFLDTSERRAEPSAAGSASAALLLALYLAVGACLVHRYGGGGMAAFVAYTAALGVLAWRTATRRPT